MKKFRIVAILLVMCLASSCFVGSTFAKYSSTASGSDDALVAKWSIILSNAQIAVAEPQTVSFNLFNTINESATSDSAETNVESGMLAPGTGGKFELAISNNSDVDAEWTITLEETVTNLPAGHTVSPILYSLDGTNFKPLADLVSSNSSSLQNQSIPMTNRADSVTVYWQWAYDAQGNKDNDWGIAGQTAAPRVTVTAGVSVYQVD